MKPSASLQTRIRSRAQSVRIVQARAATYRAADVVPVNGKAAKEVLQSKGSVLLDVRSPYESSKVSLIGAVNIPYSVEDPDMGPAALIKKGLYMGSAGGWWNGGTHMILNKEFVQQVESLIPNKDASIVVGCQTGVRSLSACTALTRAGYSQISWIEKGFDSCAKGDDKLPTQDDKDIRYAGIGGVSEIVGWTRVQEEEGKALFGGVQPVLGGFGVILALDLAWGFYLRQPPI